MHTEDQIFEGSQSETDLQLKLDINILPLNILPVRLIKNVTKYSVYNLSVNLKKPKQTVTLPKNNCRVKTLK